jgi:hypothetical protein
MALLSGLVLDGGGGGTTYYLPAPAPYLPPAPVYVPPPVPVNLPGPVAPVYNPTVITPFTGPGEIVTAYGGGGGLQVPVVPSPYVPAVQPPPPPPPAPTCATCGKGTTNVPAAPSGSTQPPPGGGGGIVTAGLASGSENWGLLLIILALGFGTYEAIKEKRKGR